MEIVFLMENPAGFPEQLEIPLVTGIGEIKRDSLDEEFETINGQTLNLIGGTGLRSFSFNSFFPGKKYSFIAPRKYRLLKSYVSFFERAQAAKVPLRVIVYDGLDLVINMLCRVNIAWQARDQAGDVPYTLEVKEYVRPRKVVSYV